MAENGVSNNEVATSAEPPASTAKSPFGPASLSDMMAVFASMPKEEQEKVFQLGMALGQQAAAAATAGRPAVVEQAASPGPEPTVVASPPAQAPAPAAPAQVNPPVGPDFASVEPPPGYVVIPEAVYLWTAQASAGIPLWGLLVQGRKREGSIAGRLVFKLLKASHAMTRAGKRVVVPTGGFVMVTLTDALEPFLQLVDHKDGCAALWIRALGEIPVEGGGTVPALDVRFEPSPEHPGQPRRYARDLLSKRTA